MNRQSFSKRKRFRVLLRDHSTCRYCGASAPDVQIVVDHLVPVVLGGTNDDFNLVAACHDCNAGKSAMQLDDETLRLQLAYVIHGIISKRFKVSPSDRDRMICYVTDILEMGATIGIISAAAAKCKDFDEFASWTWPGPALSEDCVPTKMPQ